jgi:hypothetical protein
MTQQPWGPPPQQPQQPQWGPPPQQYPPQPQQWGPPPQQPQQQSAPMPTVEGFFAGGQSHPAPRFKEVNDAVYGTILSMDPRQRRNTKGELLFNKDGSPQVQLVVTLQTDLRGWQGVNKIPTDPAGQPLPPDQDDGRRNVYVWFKSRDAVSEAVARAGKQFPEVGGKLGLKVTALLPNSQGGDPIKDYVALYEPPGAQPQQQAPAQPQYAPPPAQPQQWQQPGPSQQFQQAVGQPQYAPAPQYGQPPVQPDQPPF